ncbi:6PGD fold domain-containing protein, partial [Corynebacterium nasicanis]
MRAPRMRVGVYGDSRTSSLPDLLSTAGHDVSYMDYDPSPPPVEELDLVVLEVRDTLLESAVERLAERARRGQIFIHTSLQHGVIVMDPLEVTGAVVIAMGELSPTRWAVTTADELGDTIAELLLGEVGASGVPCADEERLRLDGGITYVEAGHSLRRDAMRLLGDAVGDIQEADDIVSARGT